ncbi:hypothetical protein B0H63DRAFT_394993 [Podospora didyma]|uniref:Kelch repeat protein n=1 Tax=Podospora didyma TaxID=330526 RepID=A0AAE0U0C5_9PEZI|nr:hypothetical protein B0H63DRAFT_394993 [Podospora didyma]
MVSNRALRRLFLGVLGSGCVQLVAALSDAPTVTNYLRKGQTSATLLGNYIYMDGGEISQLTNGNINLKDRLSNQVNSTISVDLSTSWTTSNVVLRTIPKTGPIKNNVVLWTDSSANTFYSWGGKWSWGKNMADTQLWKFVADGSGGGTWSVQDPANPSLFNNLIPAESGAFTTVNDTGFMIGGVASGWTEKNRLKNQAIPGMLAFNMKTKTWYNGTFAFSPFESLSGASAHYIPSFGPSGLVMVMGGHAPSVDTEPQISISPFFDLGNVTLFDPQTKKTYSQKTTGDVPPSPRSGFCTAGFKNTDGGYEIFVYGGENQRDLFYYDDGYILSLPGFVWTKVPQSTAGPRGYHSCLSIGNRQVLSIGGVNGSWIDKDPAPQGLQLFDMTSLAWKDTYDANAASYEAPEVIKKLYSNG